MSATSTLKDAGDLAMEAAAWMMVGFGICGIVWAIVAAAMQVACNG